jgi:hypothetical protein
MQIFFVEPELAAPNLLRRRRRPTKTDSSDWEDETRNRCGQETDQIEGWLMHQLSAVANQLAWIFMICKRPPDRASTAGVYSHGFALL